MRKSYVTPRKSENGFRFFTVAIPIVFLLLLLVGFKMLLNSIDSVAEKQELIISGLAISDDKQKKDAEPTPLAGEYVSKIEFVKYKNEKKEEIRVLKKHINMIQTRLKMKRIPLD